MLELEIGHEVVVEADDKVRFDFVVEYVLELEHSLASLSKWEEIWEKPFLDEEKNTPEETLSYIECMVLTPNPPKDFLSKLTQKNLVEINAYINRKMTATWFYESNIPARKSSKKITAELILYWLSNLPSIPDGIQTVHLNKLFTFIRIHEVENRTPDKKSAGQVRAEHRAENERRRAEAAARRQQ